MFDNEETIKQWIKERGGKDYDGHVVSDVARTIHGWNEARRRQSTGTRLVLATKLHQKSVLPTIAS